MQQIKSLKNRIDEALSNEQLHTNFRSAMSFLMEKRRDSFQMKNNSTMKEK